MISGGEFYKRKKNCGNFCTGTFVRIADRLFQVGNTSFQEGKYVADITEPFFINDEVEFTKRIEDMYVELHEIDSKTYEASQHKNVVKNRVNKKVFEIGVYVKFEGEDNFTRIELTEQRRKTEAPNVYHFDMLYVDDGKNYIIYTRLDFKLNSSETEKSQLADEIQITMSDIKLYGKIVSTKSYRLNFESDRIKKIED